MHNFVFYVWNPKRLGSLVDTFEIIKITFKRMLSFVPFNFSVSKIIDISMKMHPSVRRFFLRTIFSCYFFPNIVVEQHSHLILINLSFSHFPHLFLWCTQLKWLQIWDTGEFHFKAMPTTQKVVYCTLFLSVSICVCILIFSPLVYTFFIICSSYYIFRYSKRKLAKRGSEV